MGRTCKLRKTIISWAIAIMHDCDWSKRWDVTPSDLFCLTWSRQVGLKTPTRVRAPPDLCQVRALRFWIFPFNLTWREKKRMFCWAGAEATGGCWALPPTGCLRRSVIIHLQGRVFVVRRKDVCVVFLHLCDCCHCWWWCRCQMEF